MRGEHPTYCDKHVGHPKPSGDRACVACRVDEAKRDEAPATAPRTYRGVTGYHSGAAFTPVPLRFGR